MKKKEQWKQREREENRKLSIKLESSIFMYNVYNC